MKKLLLLIVCIQSINLYAQNIDFPSVAFKNKLLSANSTNTIAVDLNGNYVDIDANDDGEIQVEEAVQIKELNLYSCYFNDLTGINNFTNLTKLEFDISTLSNAHPSDLDLTGLDLINYLDVECYSLNLGHKNNLETLYLPVASSLIYTSDNATLKNLNSYLSVYNSIGYLLLLNLEELKIFNSSINHTMLDYSTLKYFYNLNKLDVSTINFDNYNPLDAPLYPTNIQSLTLKYLTEDLDILNLEAVEYLKFNSHEPQSNTNTSNLGVIDFDPLMFPNLKTLIFNRYFNPIEYLDLSSLTQLENFETRENWTNSRYGGTTFPINFGNNINLKNVYIKELPTSSLDFSGNPNLESLTIAMPDSYYDIGVDDVYINFAAENNLKEIDLYLNKRTPQESGIWRNTPRKVFFENFNSTVLETVKLDFCDFEEPINIQSEYLSSFYTEDCVFNAINFGYLPSLTNLYIYTWFPYVNYPVEDELSFDLSGCTNLSGMNIRYPTVRYVSLKNGIYQDPFNMDIANDDEGLVLCLDTSEDTRGWNLPDNYTITNYCTLYPEGLFNTITGDLLLDSGDNNCIPISNNQNGASPIIKIESIQENEETYTFSDTSNSYNQYVGLGDYMQSVTLLENPDYFSLTPQTFDVSFPDYENIENQDICLVANGDLNDLDITIIPITNAQPGFNSKYKVLVRNRGTTTLSGNFILNFDSDKVSYLSSNLAPNTVNSNNLNWSFSNLSPFNNLYAIVEFNVNTPTDENPVIGGDILNYSASIENSFTDETSENNTFNLNQTVVNAFDPNDKICLEGDFISHTQVGKYVHYLIRFENTGTASATNVVVKDEISLYKFDINSIVPIDASHNYRMTLRDENIVEFFFENIDLPFPPSEERYGYITFKIKTKSYLNIGQSFSNSADIYFDYNEPITTNNFSTTVENTLEVEDKENLIVQLEIYPNPVTDVLHFKTDDQIEKVEIYDKMGRIISSHSVTYNQINLSDLQPDTYLIKVYSKEGVSFIKIIKN